MEILKEGDVAIGRECVLAAVRNAPIYKIKNIFQGEVLLTHIENGLEVSAGYHSPSTCYYPSDEQREYQASPG